MRVEPLWLADVVTGSLPAADRAHLPRAHALLSGLQQVTTAITCARSLEEALRTMATACAEGLGYPWISLGLPDPRGDRLAIWPRFCQHPWEEARQAEQESGLLPDAPLHLGMTENLVVQVFRTGQAYLTTSLYDLVRPHLSVQRAVAVQQALGIASLAVLPLRAAGRCHGVLSIAATPARPITALDVPVLAIVAGQLAQVLEIARLHQDLRDREQQVSLLLKATIDAQEEERERICLEIHDGVAQTLAPAFHYLQALEGRPDLSDTLRTNVRKAGALVREAIREAREVIASLRPAALDTLGLVATLRHEVEDLRDQHGWHVDFDADPVRFPKAVETALYRIVHEAVNNVAKHAHASRVAVRVKQAQERIVAEVQDDGVGFDTTDLAQSAGGGDGRLAAPGTAPLRRKGVGLLSMRKRTELLHGSFDVSSSPGAGTRVRVEVPVLVHEGRADDAPDRPGTGMLGRETGGAYGANHGAHR
ncbi:MAG: GAF domain-containing protein [Chloroflexi bacterium]|nr:GAF domain-containing protein [Chloroflexota bacterium]